METCLDSHVHINYGFRNLIRQVPISSSSVGTGTLHACTSDVVENGAEEAAGWRTKGYSALGCLVPGGAVLSFPR